MSLSSLRTEVKRLSQASRPAGHVVVIKAYTCQTEKDLEAKARAALSREWKPEDLLILIAVEQPCPTRKHVHDDPIIVYARGK